jgi:hypothetical protein
MEDKALKKLIKKVNEDEKIILEQQIPDPLKYKTEPQDYKRTIPNAMKTLLEMLPVSERPSQTILDYIRRLILCTLHNENIVFFDFSIFKTSLNEHDKNWDFFVKLPSRIATCVKHIGSPENIFHLGSCILIIQLSNLCKRATEKLQIQIHGIKL